MSIETDKPLRLRHLFIGACIAVAIIGVTEGVRAVAFASVQCVKEG